MSLPGIRRSFMTLNAIVLAIGVLVDATPIARSPAQSRPPLAGDALVIIVHQSNPVDQLTRAELRRIFLFDTQTWRNGRKVTVMSREKGQAERSEAIRLICGMSDEQYDQYILFQTFRGVMSQGPREILSASAMLRFVFNAPGAIGYVPAEVVDGSTKVLRIDGLLPVDPQYPLRRRVRLSGAD
jgi:ABC-type phosphate transport system substrate-binding protein